MISFTRCARAIRRGTSPPPPLPRSPASRTENEPCSPASRPRSSSPSTRPNSRPPSRAWQVGPAGPFRPRRARMSRIPLRILVVDDSTDSARMLAVLLKREGYETRTAFDGPAAIEAATLHRPDVVLLDLTLPGISGVE